ncbi:hypothetical protein BJX61DRAFT_533115 [Aspergillus egyptiacus]|nr:hypothetical protein BJX61DRAFT_533115 [Aspergillus egyptiacus]
MPPRRSHTKSRYGCDQCKKRRVKCDERGPPCSNCVSRELECFYSKTPMTRNLPDPSPSSATGSSYGGPLSSPQLYQQPSHMAPVGPSRATELRRLELMHKFSTETYQSLCNSSSDFYIWQMVVPRKALDHDFLMNGILAIASLHIASSTEASAALTYINTALEYHNQTLTPFRLAIDDINPENCDAVFAHSVVTTIIGIALPHLTTEKDERIGMMEKIILAAELLQGVSKIQRICRPWMKLKLFTSGSDFWERANTGLDDDTQAALNDVSALTDEVTNADQRCVLKETLQMLRQCFTRYANLRDIASVLAWLATVDKEYVYALRCRQPVALLILMYWGALLHELHGRVWWGKNSGIQLVLDLLPELQTYHSRWERVLLWPKRKIGLQYATDCTRFDDRAPH